jgi:HEXXH motif-containing protein
MSPPELALTRLRSAELGKHKILLASVMRAAAHVVPDDYRRTLAAPYQLLAKVEAQAPEVVQDLLASPQFGAWTDACTRRLLIPQGRAVPDGVPLPTELGHLAVFAATAAIRSGQAFELEIPLRDGAVAFPCFGTARPGAGTAWEWGRVRQDGDGCRMQSSVSTVRLPSERDESGTVSESWSGMPRIVIDQGGPRLDVVLDSADPYLGRYGAARVQVGAEDLVAWQQMLGAAWAILTADHPSLAGVIADLVRTLVPLAPHGRTLSSSSTDTASFGAVALSLPPDVLSMAEVLVHETQHAILGALMDIVPLVRNGVDFLGYAPWRDDPRPAGALLQGIFAHYGMGQFWGQRRIMGSPEQRLRAHAEFGRLRMVTARAADDLTRSGVLTGPGRDFLDGIRAELAAWLDEPLPGFVAGHAMDVSTDHEVCWRLRHLVPDPAAIAALASAWRRGRPPPTRPAAVAVRLEPVPLPPASATIRNYLLWLPYRNPGELRRWLSGEHIDPVDAALVCGRYDDAAVGYLRRIAAGDDRDAWAGLAVTRRHTGSAAVATLLTERPEVVAAVHDRLRGAAHAEPDALAIWLAEAR